MVNCPKCGTANKDDARFCASCGSALYVERAKRRDDCFGSNEPERACFGLPYGGIIIGVVIGLLIVLWGLVQLFNLTIDLGPLVLIVVGVLILVGAIYSMSRRRY